MSTYDKLNYEKDILDGSQNFIVKLESERLKRTAYFFEVSINNETNVVTIREKRVSDDGSHFYVDEEHKVGVINVQHFRNDMRYELTYEFDGNHYWLIFRFNKGYLTIAKYLDNIVLEDFTVQIDDEYDLGIVNFKNIMNQFSEFCCYCGLRQGTLKRPVRERVVFREGEDGTKYLEQFTYLAYDDHYGRMTLKRDNGKITAYVNHNEVVSVNLTNAVCFSTIEQINDQNEDMPENQLLMCGIMAKEALDWGTACHYLLINYAYGNKLMLTTYIEINGKMLPGSLRNFYSGDFMNMALLDVKDLVGEFFEGISPNAMDSPQERI